MAFRNKKGAAPVEAAPEDNLPNVIGMDGQPVSGADPVWKPDDDQLAIDLREEWSEKVSFFQNEWRVYEHGVWSPRDVEEVEQNIREFLRKYRKKGIKVNSQQISSLAKMMRSDIYKPERVVNRAQAEGTRYINLRNGMYDLEERRLVNHRADLLLINQLDFDYDEDAACPAFDNYLHSSLTLPDGKTTDHDMVALVHQALGYTMTARVDLKVAFLLKGVPDSGKSTLLALIHDLMGNLATSIDLTKLAKKDFMLAETVGKNAVTFPEAEEGQMLPDAIFKNLVGGGDLVWSDVKHGRGIHFIPTAKIWWAMNGMMRVSDRSGATFNRFKLILFNRSFIEAEKDYSLLSKLRQERSGIFNTIMHQYHILQRNGWRKVKQSDGALAQYKNENDTEKTYLDQRCELDERNSIRGGELYSDYKLWCELNGFKPKNSNQVATDWRRLGLVDKHSGGTVWHGARLRTVKTENSA